MGLQKPTNRLPAEIPLKPVLWTVLWVTVMSYLFLSTDVSPTDGNLILSIVLALGQGLLYLYLYLRLKRANRS
jgi:hypothetical protein